MSKDRYSFIADKATADKASAWAQKNAELKAAIVEHAKECRHWSGTKEARPNSDAQFPDETYYTCEWCGASFKEGGTQFDRARGAK